jgi:hypothetical protein
MSAPDHEGFLRELRNAHSREVYVAAVLLEKTGLPVQSELVEEAETPYEAERFTEQKDLLVGGHLIEVKGRTPAFTCAEDFPYPTINVCTVKRWEARKIKPVAFVMVSIPTKALTVVFADTFPQWEIAESRDSRRGGWMTPTYRVTTDALRPFEELVEWLLR